MIENVDQRSKRSYLRSRTSIGPGHAGYTYDVKYGIHDYRGGGRASARETAARVAAGAIARKIVPGLDRARRAGADGSCTRSIGALGLNEIDKNPFFCPDAEAGASSSRSISTACARAGSSCGAVIEVVAEGVPAGLGAPVYAKLDGDLRVGADGHQRRQGRGDRRRLCHGGHERRRQRRRDAHGQ